MGHTARRLLLTGAVACGGVAAAALVRQAACPPPAVASCAGPWVDVVPAETRAGQVVTVTGSAFAVGCNDTGETDRCGRLVRPVPVREVTVTLLPAAGPEVTLGVVHPGYDYGFVLRVPLPAVAPGRALVEADFAEPHPLLVTG